MSGEAGKGDKPRPVDRRKWDANFESIKWASTSKRKSKPAGGK